MSLIEIKHTEGSITSEPVQLGDVVAVEAGEDIHCQFAFAELSSIVRVGEDLLLTLGNTAPTQFEGFFIPEFSPKPLLLHFTDRDFTVSEVKQLFDTFFSKIDNDGIEQTIALRSGSVLNVIFGNQYLCDAQEFAVKNLQRRGEDLYIASVQQPDKPSIILKQFFTSPTEGQEPPKLLLQDPHSGRANDIMIHPKSSVFQWQGEPLPMAIAGSMYAYYFQLSGPDADQFVLTAGTDKGVLPEWLTFARLGDGRYLLSGLPTKDVIGKESINISAHSTTENLSMHTQQAFVLEVRSRDNVTTRSAVDDIATAEFRKLGNDFMALGVTQDIPHMESAGYFPTAEIAAVSGLAVLGTTVLAQTPHYEGNVDTEAHRVIMQQDWQHWLNGSTAVNTVLTNMPAHTVTGTTAQGFVLFAGGAETASEESLGSGELANIPGQESQNVTNEVPVSNEPTEQPTEENPPLQEEPPVIFDLIHSPTPAAPATSSPVAPPIPEGPIFIDLSGAFNGFTMNGTGSFDELGVDATIVPDVNGDGIDDLLVGAMSGVSGNGEAYLVMGSATGFPAQFDINTSGVTQTTFSAPSGPNLSTHQVVNIGDFNGDHINDMLIVPTFNSTAYIVYGIQGDFPSSVDLTNLVASGGGVAINVGAFSTSIDAGTYLGDVNGDGIADILIAEVTTFPTTQNKFVVVFGSNNPSSNIDLSTMNGNNGFVLSAPSHSSIVGPTGVDINGDGYNDIMVNFYGASPYNNEVAVVFGKASGFSSAINPTTLPVGQGLIIHDSSAPLSGYSGFGVRFAGNIGDVNHDGYDDVMIIEKNTGTAFVIFGSPTLSTVSTFDVATLDGHNGFKLSGSTYVYMTSASFAGDVNGDGIADFIIVNASANNWQGAAYVIFGTASGFPAAIDLSNLSPSEGFTITGPVTNLSGLYSVGGGGDVNGDGLSDVVVSGYFVNSGSGASYLVYGANFNHHITIMGTSGNDTLTGTSGNDVIFAGAGNDTINALGGNDFINGGSGANIINAGQGNDTIVYYKLNSAVSGGTGFDTLWFQSDGNYVDFRGNAVYTGIDQLNLMSMRTLTGNTVILDAATVLAMSDANHMTVIGNAHSTLYLYALDAWTASSVISGFTTYTSSSGSVVDVQNGIDVKLPTIINDSALNGVNGFEILPLTAGPANSLFGFPISVVHNPLGNGFDYLLINAELGLPSFKGVSYLIPGTTAIQPAAVPVDAGSLNTLTITNTAGVVFGTDAIGNFAGFGTNGLSFVTYQAGPHGYIVLTPVSALDNSQDLSALSTVEIMPGASGPINSFVLTGVGDFSGDGLADIAISNRWVPNIWVVFGSNSLPATLNLTNDLTGNNGFEIVNSNPSFANISELISVNINGDGFSEIIYHYNDASTNADVVIAVLGHSAPFAASVNSATLIANHQAFYITDTAHPNSGFGSIMADMGSFNGSHYNSVAIAEPSTGTVYVIYGNPTFSAGNTFDVSSLNGSNGFALTAPSGDIITAIGFAGDMNGDGLADFAVATYNATAHISDIYVLFGGSGILAGTPGHVSLALEADLIIQHGGGPVGTNQIGSIVAMDYNGDGLSDLVYSQQVNIYTNPVGAAYVIYGENFSNHITLQASASNSTLNGVGNDVIFAGSFDNVTINAGPGNNFINTGSGHDIINGGTGNNTIVFSALDTAVNAGTGHNTLLFQQDGIFEDFTATSVFTGFDTIDLQPLLSKQGNTIELNADSIFAMTNSGQLTINGGGLDSVHLQAADGWVFAGGAPGYSAYMNTVGSHFVIVQIENTMHPVVFV